MTILEIILLLLLSCSLIANYRLFQLFRCYKEAYKAAISYDGPDIFSRISQLAAPVAIGVMLYFAYKKLKQEGAL